MAKNILTQGVTVTVDAIVLGVPAGAPTDVECILELGNLKQTRASEKFACMSSNNEFQSVGSITRDNLTLQAPYDDASVDGLGKLEDAFNDASLVAIEIEFNNSGGANGTQISGNAYVISFELTMEKDKIVLTNFELGWDGPIAIVPAA